MRTSLLLLVVTVATAGGYLWYERYGFSLPELVEPSGSHRPATISSEPLTPEQASDRFVIDAEYRIELVAAEPLVQAPVSIRFDELGRIWVVEMRGYMRDANGTGEGEPYGGIAILEDRDRDGRMDTRIDFLKDVPLPRGVLPLGAHDALVVIPPNFVHVKDTDGDFVADERVIVGSRFADGVRDPEYAPNSPAFGIDNWIHAAHWVERFRYRDGRWATSPVAFSGQWGLARNDRGTWFFNSNEDPLRAHLAPPRHAARDIAIEEPAYFDHVVAHDKRVWPARATPGVNRGYRPGVLRDDGRLANFTSAAAPVIYRGDLMPALRGNAFVAEPAANLIHREIVEENGTALAGRPAYARREFLASSDERFRPVDLQNGPDGALYIADMYRGIIQHRARLSEYLLEQIRDRELETPLDRGRIWRIVPAASPRPAATPTIPADAESLVALFSHGNGWVRDTAQQMLVHQPSRAQTESYALKLLSVAPLGPADDGIAHVHAMWTLEGIGMLERDVVLQALQAKVPVVREHAVRLTAGWISNSVDAVVLSALETRASEETNPQVALQLAFTLGETSRQDRQARSRAESSLVELLTRERSDAAIRDAVVSSFSGAEVELLRRLAADDRWNQEDPNGDLVVARSTESVFLRFQARLADELFQFAASVESSWINRVVLETWLEFSRSHGRATTAEVSPELESLIADGDQAISRLASQIRESSETDGHRERPTPTAAQRKRIERGADAYRERCSMCHHTNGRGVSGLAPRLAGSDWVTGDPKRLVRILLHGLEGPVEVAGRVFQASSMPEHSMRPDDEIADVSTYVRQAWGNSADAVDAEFVDAIRRAEKDRTTPWTAEELLELR